MIYESLLFLKNQLNKYYAAMHDIDENIEEQPVDLVNIATLDEEGVKNADGVFITLVNISEEATMKNVPHFRKENAETVYAQPPVYLNLFVLFSVCMISDYSKALLHLSHIIKFFQGKNTFTHKDATDEQPFAEGFKLIMDLHSPGFEQSNFLWGTLGGKQHPSVLYKMRLLEIKRDSIAEKRGIITEIQLKD